MTTPSYYPPGWDRERWKRATSEELETLTEEDLEKFHSGLRAGVGEAGAEAFANEVYEYRRLQQPLPESSTMPNFVNMLKRLCPDGFPEWGYTVYRTAGYNDDAIATYARTTIEAKINKFLDRLIASLTPDIREEAQSARSRFSLRWIEASDLDGRNPEEIGR